MTVFTEKRLVRYEQLMLRASDKRVIPFVTAGANGKESSYRTIVELLPDSEITDHFYTSNLKRSDAGVWLDSIRL